MKDQVDGLRHRSIAATYINSSLSPDLQQQRLQGLAESKYKLVYIAPERLRSTAFLNALTRLKVGLLAVDEAHLIDQWGHDFRPEYQRIAELRRRLGNPVTVALTATATPKVQKAITRSLKMTKYRRIVTGFDRPNLTYTVHPAAPREKMDLLCGFVSEVNDGAAIVYVATRRQAEDVAEGLQDRLRLRVPHYHAGLYPERRTAVQNAFMSGKLRIVVATNAFGMGIDRPDVRLVVHYAMPGSIEAYYQEAGRAGRDGQPAAARMLFTRGDRGLQEFLINESFPKLRELRKVFDVVGAEVDGDGISLTELRAVTDMYETKLNVALARLESVGLVKRYGHNGQHVKIVSKQWDEEAVQAEVEKMQRHRDRRLDRLDQMVGFAERPTGHRQLLLAYFGEIPWDDVPQPKLRSNRADRARTEPVPQPHVNRRAGDGQPSRSYTPAVTTNYVQSGDVTKRVHELVLVRRASEALFSRQFL